MNLDYFKAAALSSVTAFALAGCVLLVQASSAIKSASDDSHTITAEAVQTLLQFQELGDKLDTTVDSSSKLINDSRYTLAEVNRNILDERKMYEKEFPAMVAHVNGVLSNVETDTADLHPLLIEATARARDLQPIEANAADFIKGVHDQFTDPHIAASIANLDDATAQIAIASTQTAAAMVSIRAIALDSQHEVHSFVYPKPLVSIANWMLKIIHAAGGWF